jgi:hypothetical protein
VHEQIGGHSDSSGLLVVWVPYDPQTGASGHVQTGRDSSAEGFEHDETENLDGDEAVDDGASAGASTRRPSVVPPTPKKGGSLSGPGWTYDASKAPQQTGEQLFHSVAKAAAEDPDRPRPKREGKAPVAKGTQTSLSVSLLLNMMTPIRYLRVLLTLTYSRRDSSKLCKAKTLNHHSWCRSQEAPASRFH